MTDQEYRRLYYRVNRERQCAYARAYYLAHRDHLMDLNRQYRMAHSETINARVERNHQQNRTNPEIQRLAGIFRAWRKRQGMTQTDVSVLYGISVASISKAETARIKMSERLMEVLRREGLDCAAG